MNLPLANRMGRCSLWSLLVLLLAGCRDNSSSADNGDRSQESSLRVYDLAGQPADPFDIKEAKAVVFIFLATDCPISNRYAPEIRRLHERFESRDIAFRLIYPDRDTSAEAIQTHLEEYELPPAAFRDARHALVKLAGATVTPEAAVFLPDRKLIYRGRIDDRYVALGKERAQPTRHDLLEVLESVVAQKPLAFSSTRAVGCYISAYP